MNTKESAAEFLAMSARGWADGTEFGYEDPRPRRASKHLN